MVRAVDVELGAGMVSDSDRNPGNDKEPIAIDNRDAWIDWGVCEEKGTGKDRNDEGTFNGARAVGLWKYSRHSNYVGEICFW